MLIFNDSTLTIANAAREAANKHGDFNGQTYGLSLLGGIIAEVWGDLQIELAKHSIEAIMRHLKIVVPELVSSTEDEHSVGPTGSGATTISTQLNAVMNIQHPIFEVLNGLDSELRGGYEVRGNMIRLFGRKDPMTISFWANMKLAQPANGDPIGIEGGYSYLTNAIAARISDGTITDVNRAAQERADIALRNIVSLGLKNERTLEQPHYSVLDTGAYLSGDGSFDQFNQSGRFGVPRV
jgi:hypothetical protein